MKNEWCKTFDKDIKALKKSVENSRKIIDGKSDSDEAMVSGEQASQCLKKNYAAFTALLKAIGA